MIWFIKSNSWHLKTENNIKTKHESEITAHVITTKNDPNIKCE